MMGTKKADTGELLPKSLKVGPFAYTVSTDELDILKGSSDCSNPVQGCCNSTKLIVAIDNTLHHDVICETLIHECLHTLTSLTGINVDLSFEEEEKLVNRLSPALLCLLRDNDTLVNFLLTNVD